MFFDSLQHTKKINRPSLRAFSDNKLNVTEKVKYVVEKVKDIVENVTEEVKYILWKKEKMLVTMVTMVLKGFFLKVIKSPDYQSLW